MDKKLHSFLNSDLIDKYILGTATLSEQSEVELYISKYPEAKAEYDRLQNNLEIIAKVNAQEAPKFVLDTILSEINNEQPVIKFDAYPKRRTPWYSIAASVAALIFAGSSVLLYLQNKSLINENQVVVDEIFDLRSDIDKNNAMLDNVMRQFMKLNNPETEKYVLRGNERAKDLKTIAYINPVDKTSIIDVVSLPKIPDNQTYQIWAELQDRMVNLGILSANERKLKSIPYMEDALGLSITIESKDPNEKNTDNSVAEIALKNNN